MTIHPYRCGDQDTLMAYLYDDLPPAQRAVVATHLATCLSCREEVDGLLAVRETLTAWAPPEPAWVREVVSARAPVAVPVASGWRAVPAWAQLVAATLLVATAVSIANVRVHSDAQGVTITTGWMRATDAVAAADTPAGAASPSARPASAASVTATAAPAEPSVAPPAGEEPWRVALAETEARLRAELRARPTTVATTPTDPAALQRVEALIAESERRQQQELALRLAQFGRDVDVQRRSDLVRLEQGVGQMQGRTGAEVARQREMLNYIVRTGLRPPQ